VTVGARPRTLLGELDYVALRLRPGHRNCFSAIACTSPTINRTAMASTPALRTRRCSRDAAPIARKSVSSDDGPGRLRAGSRLNSRLRCRTFLAASGRMSSAILRACCRNESVASYMLTKHNSVRLQRSAFADAVIGVPGEDFIAAETGCLSRCAIGAPIASVRTVVENDEAARLQMAVYVFEISH
jgi:hypothetical protein